MEALLSCLHIVLTIFEYMMIYSCFLQFDFRHTFTFPFLIGLIGTPIAAIISPGVGISVTFGIILATCIAWRLGRVCLRRILRICFIVVPVTCIIEEWIDFILRFSSLTADYRTIIYVVVVVILSAVIKYLTRNHSIADVVTFSGKEYLILSTVAWILMLLISYFSYVMTMVEPSLGKNIGFMLFLLGDAIILVAFFVLYRLYVNRHEDRSYIDTLEHYIEQQKDYFELLLKKESDTRKFRHDITDELLSVQYLLRNDRLSDAMKLIGDGIIDIQKIGDEVFSVGISVVDSLLNYYFAPHHNDYEIDIRSDVKDEVKIAPRDLCLITANMFKNAAEAMDNSDGERFVHIDIQCGKTYFQIEIENSYDEEERKDRSGRGLGGEIIRRVIRNYDGKYITKVKERSFYSLVILKNTVE